MFLFLARVVVGEHLYWNFLDSTLHGEVILGMISVFTFLLTLLSVERTPQRTHGFIGKTPLTISQKKRETGIRLIPRTFQNFSEGVFEYLSDLVKDKMGPFQYKLYIPYVGTIFLIVLTANWSGALLPWKLIRLAEGECSAPTNDINTTLALSLLTSISYFYAGIAGFGINFFTRYISPTPLFFPINLLEDCTKPLSLTFRLFGNVLAEEIVLSVLCIFVPVIIPLPIMLLGIFSASVQALVFSTLSSTYLAESLEN
jgi:F-type H+-transporting ATPase subunit a